MQHAEAPTPATPAHPRTVSVVIPVKNDALLLRRCLRALARQTRPPDEIIVVDNGSTDDSADVATHGAARVVVCGDPGIGAASARGYDAATGDLVLRLDADSIPPPSWVETIVAAFDRRPDIDAFTGGARFIDGPRRVRALLSAVYLGSYLVVGACALGHIPLYGSNVAFRQRAWRRVRSAVHRHAPELHDDLDLSYHLGEGHRLRYLPGAVVGISMRPFARDAQFSRRVARGFRSVVVHWPADFPPVRWVKLLLRSPVRRIRGAAG